MSVGSISSTFKGQTKNFPLLSAEDLVSLTRTIPNPTGDIINLAALDKWSQNPLGCDQFLLTSIQKSEPSAKMDGIKAWGSIMRRCKLANEIFIASITSGEEDDSPKADTPHAQTGT